MASIVVQSGDLKTAGVFRRRVLIGRKAFNGLQVEQRVVSRIHAWIDEAPGGFYIADARSRGGTWLNGQRVVGKVMLQEGDEIYIGPATLVFHTGDELPPDAKVFDISEEGANPDFKNPGILMKCKCGAPLWVPASMAGAYGKCATCSDDIVVPGAPLTGIRRPLTPNDSIVDLPAISETLDQVEEFDPLAADVQMLSEPADQTCSICQSSILPGDPIETCESCSQTYHAECWRENLGCAAYGCANVGALAPQASAAQTAAIAEAAETAVVSSEVTEPHTAPEPAAFPWDFALLGASVFAVILGSVTFGVPALAVAGLCIAYAIRSQAGRSRVAALSAVISILGMAGGALVSWYWWFNFSTTVLK